MNVTNEIRGTEFNVPLGLSERQAQSLLDSEMEGVKGVFWFLLGVSTVTFILNLAVEDHELPGDEKNKDNKEKTEDASQETK